MHSLLLPTPLMVALVFATIILTIHAHPSTSPLALSASPPSNPNPSSSESPTYQQKNQDPEPKCISIDSSSTYLCTSTPEEARRAISSSGEGGRNLIPSVADLDLGVEQRIAGSDAEKERIYKVLRNMEKYLEDEVLSRAEYEHVRTRCKNHHELCAFWSSVGECETNRGFMVNNCAAACRLCLLLHTNMVA